MLQSTGPEAHGDVTGATGAAGAPRSPADAPCSPLPAPRPTRGSRLCRRRVLCLPRAAACPLGSSGAGSVPGAVPSLGARLRSGCSALCSPCVSTRSAALPPTATLRRPRCLGRCGRAGASCWPLGKLKLWAFLFGSLGALLCAALTGPSHGLLDGLSAPVHPAAGSARTRARYLCAHSPQWPPRLGIHSYMTDAGPNAFKKHSP